MKKIDIFCHVFPKSFHERMLTISDQAAYMQKRVREIPVMVDLDLRFRIMDSFPAYVQVPTLSAPPMEVLGGPKESPEHALLHIGRLVGDCEHPLVKAFGKEMAKNIDFFHGVCYNAGRVGRRKFLSFRPASKRIQNGGRATLSPAWGVDLLSPTNPTWAAGARALVRPPSVLFSPALHHGSAVRDAGVSCPSTGSSGASAGPMATRFTAGPAGPGLKSSTMPAAPRRGESTKGAIA